MQSNEDTKPPVRGSTAFSRVLITVLLALMGAILVLIPLSQADAAVNRKNVATARTDTGLPAWYQDAGGFRMAPCTEGALCAIEDPTLPQGEVIYWSGEASIPVGRRSVDLVMAVEGSFINPNGTEAAAPGPDTIPITGSVLLVRGNGLVANTFYRITHPYGTMRVQTDDRGRFSRLIENGCDLEGAGETCNFNLALGNPVFNGFLRWDPAVAPAAPAGFLGDPEINHRVVGSPVKNKAGNPQNYFQVERLRTGAPPIHVGRTGRFSITGQVINPLPTNMVLSATPAQVNIGRATRLSGKLETALGQNLAGKNVVITRKVAGSPAFRPLPGGRLTTRADGSFNLRVASVRKNTVYKAQFTGEPGELWPSANLTRVRVAR